MNIPPLEHVPVLDAPVTKSEQQPIATVETSSHQCELIKFESRPLSQTNPQPDPAQLDPAVAAKRFPCVSCDKWFQTSKHLSRHFETVHSAERKFECNECGFRFKRKDKLKRHVDSVHKQIRNHECPICNQRFSRRDHLKNHQRVHYGQKQFQCIDCKKKFTSLEELQQHQCNHIKRQHTNRTTKIKQPQPNQHKLTQPPPPSIPLKSSSQSQPAATSAHTSCNGTEQKECHTHKYKQETDVETRLINLQHAVDVWRNEAQVLRNENTFLKNKLRELETKQTTMPLAPPMVHQEAEDAQYTPVQYTTHSSSEDQSLCTQWVASDHLFRM
mmetsp:Transcript_51627/g.85544  ORF Transcript_51627/g.85544 Transcript_51627/m.85544 type:complete len:329 (-) Transcript_51627:29-1015(-)